MNKSAKLLVRKNVKNLANKNATSLVINLVKKLKLAKRNATSLAINLAKKHKTAKLKQNATINMNINMKVATISINQK